MKNHHLHYQQILPVGCHEAGHYVVAKLLGFKTGSLKIEIKNNSPKGGSALELVRGLSNVKDIVSYLENRVQVLFAGALAESLSNGKIDEDLANIILENSSQFDFAKARELIHLIRNIKYSKAKGSDIQDNLNEITNNYGRNRRCW